MREQLDYNQVSSRLVGLSIDDPVWDATVFYEKWGRLFDGDIAGKSFVAALNLQVCNLFSNQHFSVNVEVIDASMESFVPTDDERGSGKSGRSGGGCKNDTHSSSIDPDGRPCSEAAGKEAKLCRMSDTMTQNRHGLILNVRLTEAEGAAERAAALAMIEDNAKPSSTLGGNKNCHTAEIVAGCRERSCTPPVSPNYTHRRSAIDGGTTLDPVYRVTAIKR